MSQVPMKFFCVSAGPAPKKQGESPENLDSVSQALFAPSFIILTKREGQAKLWALKVK